MKRFICTVAFINILLVSSFCQDTLKAVLVKNINQVSSSNSFDNSSWPGNFTVSNNKLVFTAYSVSNSNDHDLWTSDGTNKGTQLIKDINARSASYIGQLTVWGNKIIFSANDGISGKEPWITDGTPENTRMIKDIKPNNPNYPNSSVDGSEARNFKIFKDKAYFQAETWYGDQLFVTDGTDAGTVMLTKTGTGDFEVYGFIEFNDQLFFSCSSNYFTPQLWVTDGTVDGTHEFKAFVNGSVGFLSISQSAIVYKNKLFFSASIYPLGMELWVSDGTHSGTQLFKDINGTEGRGSIPHGFTIFKDNLYFIADDGIHGNELWCTNEDSTFLVKDIGMNGGALDYAKIYVANDRLFFAAQTIKDGFAELWTSDGTAEGTEKLPANDGNTVEAPTTFTEWKGKIVFVAGEYNKQLWITDGTSQNTRPVLPDSNTKWNALGSNSSMVNFQGDLYFNAHFRDSIGCELYKLKVDTSLIPLNILQQPHSNNICMGDSAVFEVKVSGSPELKFQWMKNYGLIENATQATYKIANARIEDAGDYLCIIKNNEGEINSHSASLGVYELNSLFEVIDSTQHGFYLIRFTGNAPSSAAYHWNFDEGEIISGSGQGPYHVAWNNSGQKNITLNVILNTCASETSKTVEIISTGNISTNTISPILSIYPNPVKSNLTLNFNQSAGGKRVSLFDVYGHLIFEKQTNEISLNLNLSDITPGMYFVRVQDDASFAIKKIIKE